MTTNIPKDSSAILTQVELKEAIANLKAGRPVTIGSPNAPSVIVVEMHPDKKARSVRVCLEVKDNEQHPPKHVHPPY